MTEPEPVEHVRVAVIGAGFGGLTAAHRLAERGIDDVVILERSDGVGGTWRANRYPGAACDVPSHLYSLSFAPNPRWSRSYASQPEILAYVEDCYDRFDVRRKVRTDTTVVSCEWHEVQAAWRLRDDRGGELDADVVVSAIGMFHTPLIPDLPGRDDFAGTAFHSARWDPAIDLTGRRVAVIGTGASAIQIVPSIAEQTGHLTVFQRTPPWIFPRPDEPFSAEQQQRFADDPVEAHRFRAEIEAYFERNTSFVRGDPIAAVIDGMARDHLAKAVADEELRDRLTPRYAIGCKRVLVSSDFYPAVQRDDVELVTERIERITADGVVTADGVEHLVDTIVWCTGFRASEYLRGIEVVGRDGRSIHDEWAGVPRAHLGMTVAGFPNLFMLYGPNTNQAANSILLILEAQAGYVADLVATMGAEGIGAAEVRADVMARYGDELRQALEGTVWHGGCATYFHAASGDIVTQLPHPSRWYRDRTARVDLDDFELTSRTG